MRRLVLLAAVFGFALSITPAAGPPVLARPAIQLESARGLTQVWVEIPGRDGNPQRSLLRETDKTVAARNTGGDPMGRAVFVSWDEEGESWFSYSRDEGATWAKSRQLRTELRLRDGTIAPGTPMPAASEGFALPASGRLFVVQFRTVGLPEWRETLTGLGAEVLSHVPHNSHIVRLDSEALANVRSLDFVERVEPYHPWYRVEPDLREEILGAGSAGFGVQRVRVTTFEWGPAGKQRVVQAAEALGAQVAEYWPSGQIMELWVDQDQLRALASHDDVLWIDRWTPIGTDMGLVREDAGSNWVENNFGYCGQGVRGEVMDGGVQDDHPDFDGIQFHGTYDLDSHGTATYGIVFGNGDRDGDGEGQAIGHMPCAQGIFADNGEFTDRFAHTQELKQDPYFASFQTNSWGNTQITSYTSVSQEMDDIIWRLDIAITQSQSNTGNQSSRPQAWAKNIISVGGIYHYDTLDTSDDSWSSGASIGPAADGRIKPDVSYWYDEIYTTSTDSGYTQFGGTSAATPETAGTLGLMVEMWADNVWETDPVGSTVFEKQPHASTIKALLINNAQQYDFVGSGHDLSRFKQGWGRPSARVAYERAANSLVVDEEELLALNDAITYSVAVIPGESELRVTMLYPDPPGTTSSSMHRINDVNLTVTSPSATVYHGNVGLEDGPESTPGGSPDGLNTVENVFVRNPEPGIWSVEIEAVEVNQDAHLDTPGDDVTFALVVTGGAAVHTSGQGEIRLDPSNNSCDQPFRMRVRDGNIGSSTLTVDIGSDTETAPETVTLQETTSGSRIYTASIPTSSGAAVIGDGVLSTTDGDTVTVEYIDDDDGQGGTSVVLQETATIDCLAPVISQVGTSAVTDTEATITWITDEGSDSTVDWGTATPPDRSASRAGNDSFHTVRLSGLRECTTYFFAVGSADPVGNASQDDNGGAYYLFTTMTRTDGMLHSCRAGRLVLEADAVSCAGNVPVRLKDADLNVDGNVAEMVPVALSSSTETTPEIVILTETGLNTGEFTGSILTGPEPVVANDGILQTRHGDLVTGRHDDADDGTGTAVTSTYTIEADCEGAVVSSVAVSDITDSSATVSWITSESTTGYVDWGTTPALGNQVASGSTTSNHSVSIGSLPACGRIYFRVVTSDTFGNAGVGDTSGDPFEFNAYKVPGVFQEYGFETDAGWNLAGEWEISQPQGLGSAPGDPTAAFSGTGVLGHDLSGLGAHPGDYEPDSAEAAISPVIDASGLVNAELGFRRWLNVLNGTITYLEITDESGTWNEVWRSPVPGGLTDSSWTTQSYDVSQWADRNSNLQIRFRNVSHIATSFDAGWNVDALTLRDGSLPPFDTCGGCAGAPSFAGLVSATDDDPCADTGVTLDWSTAPGWGTGIAGTYAVYRDTQPDFVPSPGNLVASGIAGTSWGDTTVPNDVTFYYLVRAENDETCGSGPNNSGVLDSNAVYGMARDATDQPLPGDVGNTLFIESVNAAHTRLTWSATPDAAAYNVYRSTVPNAPFGREAAIAETIYEDRDAMTDAQSFYYLVQAADACGSEDP